MSPITFRHDDVIIIFRVTGPLCGEFTGPGEFPAQRPVPRSFDVFFDLRLNKRLSKQSRGWRFETPTWPLWRQRNELHQWYWGNHRTEPVSRKQPRRVSVDKPYVSGRTILCIYNKPNKCVYVMVYTVFILYLYDMTRHSLPYIYQMKDL